MSLARSVMEQRISFVTLAVRDLDRSRAFYVDGLGWAPELDVPGEVLMFAVGERLVLSLWDRAAFEAEVGSPVLAGEGVPPVTLAHNLPRAADVDDVLGLARGGRRPGLGPESAATGAGSPATSPTPTASAGRWRGTPARSASGSSPRPTRTPGPEPRPDQALRARRAW